MNSCGVCRVEYVVRILYSLNSQTQAYDRGPRVSNHDYFAFPR